MDIMSIREAPLTKKILNQNYECASDYIVYYKKCEYKQSKIILF